MPRSVDARWLAMLLWPLQGCADDEGLGPEVAWAGRAAEAMCAAIFESDCGCVSSQDSQAGCVESRRQTMRNDQLAASEDGNVFDLACADAHIEQIEMLGCQTISDHVESGVTPMCQIYSGIKQLGEPCTAYFSAIISGTPPIGLWMSDCEQGLLCVLDRCATPEMPYVMIQPGEPCIDADTSIPLGICPEDEACNRETGLCTTRAALGESCEGGISCKESWCDDGVCAPGKPNGESCTTAFECASVACSSGVCADGGPDAIACFPYAL